VKRNLDVNLKVGKSDDRIFKENFIGMEEMTSSRYG